MAEKKKFDDPLDVLGRTTGSAQNPSSSKRTKTFDSPTERLSARQVAEVTQSKSLAGKYMRKTLTLPPEQIHYINKMAEQEDIGLLEFYRWLIDLGLQAYENGARPEVRSKTVRGEARKEHWSSQV
jgi:hypothetical protein